VRSAVCLKLNEWQSEAAPFIDFGGPLCRAATDDVIALQLAKVTPPSFWGRETHGPLSI